MQQPFASDVNPLAVFDFLPPSPVQPPQLADNFLDIPDSPILPPLDLDLLHISDDRLHSPIRIDRPPAPPSPAVKPPSLLPIDLTLLDIPDSPPTMSMHVDSGHIPNPALPAVDIIDLTGIEDSPSCSPGPIPPSYDLSPALPIITSTAALFRTALANKMTERAHIQKWLDTVRMQLAECDRQIMTLESIELMWDESARIANTQE